MAPCPAHMNIISKKCCIRKNVMISKDTSPEGYQLPFTMLEIAHCASLHGRELLDVAEASRLK